MRRRSSIVAVLLLVGLVLGALPAFAQETAATWGGIKQLYAGDEPAVRRGPGVSAEAAEAAHRAVLAQAGMFGSGPAMVRTVARSESGVILVVHTRTAAGQECAHLVTNDGRYVRGVALDPERGRFRDAVTGAVLLEFEVGEGPDPAGVEDLIQDFARRMGTVACNALATAVMEKCAAATVVVGNFPAAFGCVAAGAAVLMACEAMMNLHYQMDDPELGRDGVEPQPDPSPADTSG